MNNNTISDKDLKKLAETFHRQVKEIFSQNETMFVEFEDSQIIKLGNINQEIDFSEPRCCYCGNPGTEKEPLFSCSQNSPYICKDCIILALKTYLKNGIIMDIDLSDTMPELANQFSTVMSKISEAYKSTSQSDD